MLVRQPCQTGLERDGEIRLGAYVEYNQAEGARPDELIRSAGHRSAVRNPDDRQGIKIDSSLSRVGRIEETVVTRDPGYRLVLPLRLQHQPESQCKGGRRPRARHLHQPPGNLLEAPSCLCFAAPTLRQQGMTAM
jgi:hypothetical protein